MMKKAVIILVALILETSLVFGQSHQEAYVMNGLAENLDVIRLESGSVSPNVEPLGLWPNQIIYHQNQLLVINSGYNNLQVINPQTLNTTGTVEFGANHNPYYMCPLEDGRVAVSQLLDNSVSLVNLNTMQEVASIPVGAGPEGVIQEGTELFVTITNYVGGYLPGKVYIINLITNQVCDSITVGINPQWIGKGNDGNLHVVCTGDYTTSYGRAYVINPSTHQVVQTVVLGSSPGSWAVMESGIAYLGVSIWGSGGYLLAYNTETYQVTHSDTNPLQVGGGVMGITAGQDNRLYICVTETDQFKVMDGSETIIATYQVGDGPQSVALSPFQSSVPENENTVIADHFHLNQNYPNPFNRTTSIRYSVSNLTQLASLDIMNVIGQRIRSFNVIGDGTIIWDGTDHHGIPVAGGAYWASLSGSSPQKAIRMIYLP